MTTSRNGQIIDADRRSALLVSAGKGEGAGDACDAVSVVAGAGDRPVAGSGRGVGRKWVRWTKRMKADFLDELAATCNVLHSAATIGVAPRSLYQLRRQDEVFAAGWRHALRQGYDLLELQLVGHALSGGGEVIRNGDPERPAIDVGLAMRLLKEHRDRATGKRDPGVPRATVATRQQTNLAILRKLKAIEGRLGYDPPALPSVASSTDGTAPRKLAAAPGGGPCAEEQRP